VLFYNKNYEELYDFLEKNNFDYKFINKNEILNFEDGNIFIDLDNDYEIIKILINKKYWVLTNNTYPKCELINENINGNVINTNYITDKKFILNNININIQNYIRILKEKYV